MPIAIRFIGLLLLAIGLIGDSLSAAEWTQFPSLPGREGYAGSFAGSSGGALIVAGGANFPGKKPWEGGTKVWHDPILLLERGAKEWRLIGCLPRRLGYGVSATHRDSVICVGGSDADRHYADVIRITWQKDVLIIGTLPSLPKPTANACGAVVGERLFVAGGQESPDALATSRVWQLDLAAAKPQWSEVERFPGKARILATAASFEGKFWLLGGAELVAGKDGKPERRYLRDAWSFEPARGWQRIADLPQASVAAPSPAPSDATGFYLLGGDDGSQLGVAPQEHRGFSKMAWRYDSASSSWKKHEEMIVARVTVPCVRWNDNWVIPSGEVRPGIRSPEVWRLKNP